MSENFNKESYIIMKECPICLENLDISDNIILTTDCCNQETHLLCITNWIKNPYNKNNLLCPICRQKSELLGDIASPQDYHIDLSQNNFIVDISQNINNNLMERIVPAYNNSPQISSDSSTVVEVFVHSRRLHLRNREARIISACCFLIFFGFIIYIFIQTCKIDDNC